MFEGWSLLEVFVRKGEGLIERENKDRGLLETRLNREMFKRGAYYRMGLKKRVIRGGMLERWNVREREC